MILCNLSQILTMTVAQFDDHALNNNCELQIPLGSGLNKLSDLI